LASFTAFFSFGVLTGAFFSVFLLSRALVMISLLGNVVVNPHSMTISLQLPLAAIFAITPAVMIDVRKVILELLRLSQNYVFDT
jgi:hypothetical protein